jgi:hypothetical protein
MKLHIQKIGHIHVILNLPADIPDRFTIQVDEKQIPRRCRKRPLPENAEVLAIRAKYPELKALDVMTKGLSAHDTDEELLDEYYTERARDEGLI